jgi:hypothetical protein
MVVVLKENVDLTHLNMNVLRERHPLPAVEQSLAQLAGAQVFYYIRCQLGGSGKFLSTC